MFQFKAKRDSLRATKALRGISVTSPHLALMRNQVMLTVLLCLSLTLLSGPSRAADRDRLQAFLQVTGFDVALESISLSAQQAPEMLGLSASDFGESWTQLSRQVFARHVVQGMALDMLEQTLSDDLLTHAADFYASPLGQRLVEVENASHMVEDDEKKRKEGDALLGSYGSGEGSRAQLLTDLNDAVASGDAGVRAVQEIQVRFLMAASNAGVLENELDEGALRAALREGEDELRQSIAESSLASSAYTYRDMSDDDLIAYLDALNDPRMQQVYELMNAIQHEVTADRYEALATRMADLQQSQEL